ncbi:Hypothetical_protein [Hexamita inflata]|uniref:Hypothetical_protein n=1 Tax=Hexamita inflata TaxID=28002 RepID=A0AA86TYC1_9EUKA|nr:Hypothetical protein HINF_LOCUS12858 [Hexamita inflata]
MIYIDYNTCQNYCNDGTCEYNFNSVLDRDEYTCQSDGISVWWWLMLIPIVVPIIFAIVLCCCYRKEEKDYYKSLEAKKVEQNKPTNSPQKTQVNKNVTGVAPQGQLVTLLNGQIGVFVPQTFQKQTPARQVQTQQPPQFYQPQPIYQQQIYQPQMIAQQQVQQAPPQYQYNVNPQMQQTVPYNAFQMPLIPAVNQ